MTESRPASHFERLYAAAPDPWSFISSRYEQAKYRETVATLGDRRFTSGLEVGCSIGVLTRLLATRCDRMLGIDLVETPLRAARERCADQPWVEFERMRVPESWPQGRFDLIVLSEVLYFLSLADIDHCATHTLETLLPGGVVVIVNWLGEIDDPTHGNSAAERFISASALRARRQDFHQHYRLDVLDAL